jgi:RNA polymerase sigma-70 factor (ECF subfamily)
MAACNDDRALMVRFGREGDHAAFEELVRLWDHKLLGFLAKATGDFEAAEDLRQEVFVRVYRHGATYRPEYAFSTWLYRITGNVLKTWQARRGRRGMVERRGWEVLRERADGAPGPGLQAQYAETVEGVRRAVAALSPEARELILLRLDLGLTYREIGEIQNAPEQTVKSRFYAALSRLRAALETAEAVKRSSES